MNEYLDQNKLISSVVLIVFLLAIRWLIVRILQQRPVKDDELPRRWINRITNTTSLLIALGLILIWLSEIRFVALSVAAFVVALVIATREVIQCFLGFLYLAGSRTFIVGDWIIINQQCGEVVRSDWLSTTLLEVDMESRSYSYTGKSLVIPNNQFVANTVQNLNFMRRYVAHSFSLVRESEAVDVCAAKSYILEKANQYCEPFQEVAARYNVLIEKRLGVHISGPEASVRITTNNLGKNVFTVTLFCPTGEALDIEQRLTEDFMSFWYQASTAVDARAQSAAKS